VTTKLYRVAKRGENPLLGIYEGTSGFGYDPDQEDQRGFRLYLNPDRQSEGGHSHLISGTAEDAERLLVDLARCVGGLRRAPAIGLDAKVQELYATRDALRAATAKVEEDLAKAQTDYQRLYGHLRRGDA
jgi:hypothetical protein